MAARNILLTHDKKAKIADFGLSTRIYIQTSERKGVKKGTFPFRWAAYETILNGETIKEFSDVWSFGVLMWELFHLGSAIPYGKFILSLLDYISLSYIKPLFFNEFLDKTITLRFPGNT